MKIYNCCCFISQFVPDGTLERVLKDISIENDNSKIKFSICNEKTKNNKILAEFFNSHIIIIDIIDNDPDSFIKLGIALMSDKPLLIIKNDKTNFTFNHELITEHTYPVDFNYDEIKIFQSNLSKALSTINEKLFNGTIIPSYKNPKMFIERKGTPTEYLDEKISEKVDKIITNELLKGVPPKLLLNDENKINKIKEKILKIPNIDKHLRPDSIISYIKKRIERLQEKYDSKVN